MSISSPAKTHFRQKKISAYALKNLKRVTVIGETTGGGKAGEHKRLLPNFSMFTR